MPPSPMRVETITSGERLIVLVHGHVDMATAPKLRDVLLPATDAETPQIELDLGGLAFIDSSGLNVIAAAIRALFEHGRRLTVRNASPAVVDLLTLTGLADHIELRSSAGPWP